MLPSAGRSLWADTLPDTERFAGAAAHVPADADVVIVGAGFTGLWTAWHLAHHDPSLHIVVLEREHVGFGASGRNGGWCSALLPMSLTSIADRHGDAVARRMQVAMHETVREVTRFADDHAPPGVAHLGGTVDVARNRPQQDRLRDHLAELVRFGFGPDDYRWLDPTETADVVRMTGSQGALFTPHCATVHPLRLVHALARAVAEAGVTIVEGTAARSIEAGAVDTAAGRVRAEVVVQATEGYTCQLPGQRRRMLPIYSLMVATEPLSAETWDAIGLHDRPTFADGRHMIIYGQRTADGRFAFGGRGAPYHFGSRIRPEFDHHDHIRQLLTTELVTLFPAARDAAFTHHWGGVLGAPRDWTCSVRYDRRTGLAVAGGYVGDGVATTHLAGRTLAALIAGPTADGDDELLRLPWVGHRSRRWEPEPLRWVGVNAARFAARRSDRYEAAHDAPSRWWDTVTSTLLGR